MRNRDRDDSDLTIAWTAGYHKRDDEVAQLKRELAEERVDSVANAAEWCNVLAASRFLLAIDKTADAEARRTANKERIVLWQAAGILQREADNNPKETP